VSPVRAVITGVGVVSPFGCGFGTFLDALAAGTHGVRPIRSFDASTFPAQVAGEVPVVCTNGAWVQEHIGAHAGAESRIAAWDAEGRLRDRKVAFAIVAAAEAWRHAGCGGAETSADLSLALGLEQAFLEDFPLVNGTLDFARESSPALPRVRVRSRIDLGAECVSSLLGLRGNIQVHVSACAAGAIAVAHAARRIERGSADVVVCGGADSMVNPLGLGGMTRLGAPSPRAATDACRPFDRRRDGLAIGEGAAVFVVEREDRARARGARAIARVLGSGTTQDAFKVTAPRPDGVPAAAAMTAALRHAGVDASRVDYVNAHGTGTPLNDPAEATAIRLALGTRTDAVPVSSVKGAIGHLMAAAGAIEIAAALLAFERGLLPGTAHHTELDPEIALDVIGPAPRPARIGIALSNSFGFGGQNASVVLGRAEGAS